ncbi:transketolase [Rubeoparvulum massiliense]|uniref:transketolase n=1 Tax=Rubeoparvulum massiliense TaxID=1631346 RepID=UPI00065E6D48|nr:transketolase [Rubeoparvulum massiliense]
MAQTIDQLAVNTIRTLSIDAIEKAQSGHPGMPMGTAPMAYTLWTKKMKHNPTNPHWFNRDRFVLSAGHGSMLLYSLLHLCGYDLPMEEIQQFRQWGSKTPGHPEYGHTAGVDATTGPLGQGIAMAVGMAMAEAHLAATYNRPHFSIVDHYTYAICGDGDLMEGVASEAASLAGHLQLGKLIVLYDSNDISLDGKLNMAFSENVAQRFEAYGWQVQRVENENDLAAIEAAITKAQQDPRPSLIEVKTTIGYGSPNKGGKGGKEGPHGSPLGEDEVRLTKEQYGWPLEPTFYVPEEVRTHFAEVKAAGTQAEEDWNQLFAEYEHAFPGPAQVLKDAMADKLPEKLHEVLPQFEAGKKLATRAASGEVINALADHLPTLFGGSADLASSNNTLMKKEKNFLPGQYEGRNIWFGVREFAMGAALNGMKLHGGLHVYGATFFVFSDYVRPAIRLSALQGLPVVYIFTHDSIAVGEDGPTHEPIEHLPSLRAIPNLLVMRPADANETKAAWWTALQQSDRPTVLVLSRQGLPVLAETQNALEDVKRGAYILADAKAGQPELILIATGSEVSLAMEAKAQLEQEGIATRVVSMPVWELFAEQDASYKESVLPSNVKKRLAIEMANPLGWERYVGDEGAILGIHTFGASAPGNRLLKEYGFTVENVVAEAKKLLD